MKLSKTFPKMEPADWRKLTIAVEAKNQRDWASRRLHDMEQDPDSFHLRDYLKVRAGYDTAVTTLKELG